MKLVNVVSILLFAGLAQAQTSYTEVPTTPETTTKNRGLKVSIIKSFMESDYSYRETNILNDTFIEKSGTENADQKIGIMIGWQHMRPYGLGWSAQGSHNAYKNDLITSRAEGNMSYGVNEMLHVLGGINVNLLSGDDAYDDYNIGYGFQFGMIANIQNFNISVMYVQTRNEIDYDYDGIWTSTEAELILRGVELGLGMTF